MTRGYLFIEFEVTPQNFTLQHIREERHGARRFQNVTLERATEAQIHRRR